MSEQESKGVRRIVGWGIIGLLAVIGLSIASYLYFAPWRPGGGFHYPFFFPFHFGWLGAIFLLLIVFFIARRFFGAWRGGGDGYSSYRDQQKVDVVSTVSERYAKGEITKEQFEQMLRDLRQEDKWKAEAERCKADSIALVNESADRQNIIDSFEKGARYKEDGKS